MNLFRSDLEVFITLHKLKKMFSYFRLKQNEYSVSVHWEEEISNSQRKDGDRVLNIGQK